MTKNKKLQLVSIKNSLVYWEKILDKKIPDRADYSFEDTLGKKKKEKKKYGFPLCQKYFNYKRYRSFSVCINCPVYLHTGKKYCQDTPYFNWCYHHIFDHCNKLPFWNECPECESHINDIIIFLYKIGCQYHEKHFFSYGIKTILKNMRERNMGNSSLQDDVKIVF